LSLLDVATPSLLIDGGVGLDHVGGHASAPTKPCESGVHDSGRAWNLPHARGSCIPSSSGGIRHGMLEVTQVHLQSLVSQGYMTAVELATCRMPEDPISPVQAGGYVMACVVFYE
jgi:hypothetical protein